jgi:hypothetical protein
MLDSRLPSWEGPGLRRLDRVEYQLLKDLGFNPDDLVTPARAAALLRIDEPTLLNLALAHGLPRFISSGRVCFEVDLAKVWLAFHPHLWTELCASQMVWRNQGRLA